MILSWIWCQLILLPLISLSFNFFIRRKRLRNARTILHFWPHHIISSRRFISSRTWTSIRRLRILYTWRKKNRCLILLSKNNICFDTFAKCTFISKILTWSLARSLIDSLLLSVLHESHIPCIGIFILLLLRASLILISSFRIWNC